MNFIKNISKKYNIYVSNYKYYLLYKRIGLKTGSYYLRTRPKAKTQQFTIDPDFAKKKRRCVEDNGDTCVLCSS
jgi:hypothetical protein